MPFPIVRRRFPRRRLLTPAFITFLKPAGAARPRPPACVPVRPRRAPRLRAVGCGDGPSGVGVGRAARARSAAASDSESACLFVGNGEEIIRQSVNLNTLSFSRARRFGASHLRLKSTRAEAERDARRPTRARPSRPGRRHKCGVSTRPPESQSARRECRRCGRTLLTPRSARPARTPRRVGACSTGNATRIA